MRLLFLVTSVRRTERFAMTQTPVSTLQPALTLTEFLDTRGVFLSEGGGGGSGPFVGSIGIFAGPSFVFNDPADGQPFPITNNTALFSILGTDFGGNGTSNFELPNLGGVETVGAGQGAGLPFVGLGQTFGRTSYDLTAAQLPPNLGGASAAIDTQQPSLGLNYVINTSGIFPGNSLTLNSLVASAETINDPAGWALCDGQLLAINQNQALFSLLGATNGRDGVTTFALPNLEGRTVLGTGGSNGLGAPGQVSGANAVTLTTADLPAFADLLWQNANGQASIWEMTGNTSIGGGHVGPNPGPAWKAIGTSDFNGDSLPDILWQNTTNEQVSIWEMNGTQVIGGGNVASPGRNWQAIGTGDFNDDGDSDILFQNTAGTVGIWEMNGTNVSHGGNVGPNPGPSWKAIGTGDFNDDGRSDVLFQNTNGRIAIWELNGTSVIGGGPVNPNPGPSWQAIGTGDFTHDGFSDDILFQNASTGQVSIWEMNGTSLVGGGPVSPSPGPSWHAIGTNGGSDILFQNTSGQTSIWDMNGNTLIGGGAVSPNPGPSWHAVGLT
jgi:microcystin-dependent protein